MGRAFSASTSAIDPSERVKFWNSGSSRIGGVHAEKMSDVFDAQVTLRRLEGLAIYRLSSTPHHVIMNALEPAKGNMLRLRYQQTGHSLVFQGQSSFELRPGDWMIVDPHLPHAAVNKGDVSHLWLQVPCDSLTVNEIKAARSGNPQLEMHSRLSGDLLDCMRRAVDDSEDLTQSSSRELARQMTGMFRQALGQFPQSPDPLTARQETARRARAFVDRNLQDPELSVEQIAQALGCTPRYVHKAFEGSESVSRYIWNRRLDMCRYQMEKRSTQSETLTSLAFDFGFNSSSHFSRSFRERFGTSPSAFLAQMQRAQS